MSSVNTVMLSQTSHICCSHFYRYIHVSTSLYSIKNVNGFFSPLFSLDTSKKWFPFRPNRTESCRTYTNSFARSKTKGRVCLPHCHEHLFPQRPQSSPLGGTGQPKASSAPGLTPTWITMESHTLVRPGSPPTLSFSGLLALCNGFYVCSACRDAAVKQFLR